MEELEQHSEHPKDSLFHHQVSF